MSITMTLYNNSSPVNAMNKSLSTIDTLTGNLREESEVLNPTILIERQSMTGVNYAYISEFDRYYFVNEIESVRTNLWRLSLHVDVLYTYRDAIRRNRALVYRQQNRFDLMLDDGIFRCKQNPRIYRYEFPNGLTDFNYILITAGGYQHNSSS